MSYLGVACIVGKNCKLGKQFELCAIAVLITMPCSGRATNVKRI